MSGLRYEIPFLPHLPVQLDCLTMGPADANQWMAQKLLELKSTALSRQLESTEPLYMFRDPVRGNRLPRLPTGTVTRAYNAHNQKLVELEAKILWADVSRDGICVTAFDEDRMAGFVRLTRDNSGFANNDYTIEDIYSIMPRRGIGSAVVHAALKQLQIRPVEKLSAEMYEGSSADQWYAGLGFDRPFQNHPESSLIIGAYSINLIKRGLRRRRSVDGVISRLEQKRPWLKEATDL